MAPGALRGLGFAQGPQGLQGLESVLGPPPPPVGKTNIMHDVGNIGTFAMETFDQQGNVFKITALILGGIIGVRLIRGLL